MNILGENTSKYCSRITVVHVHATVHPACHNIVNSFVDSRKTEKHVVDCTKAVCWGAK